MRPVTPPLYAKGRWESRYPFTVSPTDIYICKGINSFDDLLSRGINPYTVYYEPYGIPLTQYHKDRRLLANIVTLMSDTQPTVFIPDTYIRKYPDVTTVPYSHVVLSLSLGAVPETLSLHDFKVKIREFGYASLGLAVEIKEHIAGNVTEGVDQEVHDVLEQNRLTRLEKNRTDHAKVLMLERELKHLKEKYNIMENFLINKGLLD